MFMLAVATVGAAVYKWVDETGTTHYSETPGSGKKAEKVNMPPPPPKEVVEEAQRKFQESREEELYKKSVNRSLSLSELGKLPLRTSSEYVETLAASMLLDTQRLVGQIHLMLKAKPNLPLGAYLETHFENPENPGKSIVVGEVWRRSEQPILILSPEFRGIKCRNYQIVVYVYTEKSKDKLLGIHSQTIQSRINLDKVRSSKELVDALMAGGNCP